MGIVFDIQRCSYHDGPGIRTTVFLKGCSLRCAWCHNPESFILNPQLKYTNHLCSNCQRCQNICENNVHTFENETHKVDFSKCTACGKCEQVCPNNALSIIGKEMSSKEVIDIVLRDKSYYGNDGGLTVSGGEPTFQKGFLIELLTLAKNENIHTCIETNGYISNDTLTELLPLVDLFLVDFKLTSKEKLTELTKASGDLWDNTLSVLNSNNKKVILRMPVIQNINDNKEHMEFAAKIAAKYNNILNIEIMPYHSIGADKWNQIGLDYSLKELKSASKEEKEQWNNMLLDELDKIGFKKHA